MKAQARIDEFAFVLLAAIILIAILMIVWTTPPEPPPEVHPQFISLTVRPGETTVFSLNISPTITNVSLKVLGRLAPWISFSKNNFDVRGNYELVTVTVSVPLQTLLGTYTDRIRVTSTGGTKEVRLSVEVSNVTYLTARSVPLEDFSISNLGKRVVLDESENVEIRSSYFALNKVNLFGQLTDDQLEQLERIYVQVIVDDTNGLGNLVVLLNGKEAFNQKVGVGETLVELNISELTKANIVSVYPSRPGWYLWATATYSLRSVKLVAEFKPISKTIYFDLSREEVDRFDHLSFSALIKSSLPTPTVSIKVNNQLAYISKPPLTLFNVSVSRDILGNKLLLTLNNTLALSLTTEGTIEFSNVILTIYRRS